MKLSFCRVGRAGEQGQNPKECKHLMRGEREGERMKSHPVLEDRWIPDLSAKSLVQGPG